MTPKQFFKDNPNASVDPEVWHKIAEKLRYLESISEEDDTGINLAIRKELLRICSFCIDLRDYTVNFWRKDYYGKDY